jgi:16S rRNA processing protein RimM
MIAFDELVLVARVIKPQGRRGEVAIEPFTDRPDRFATMRRAFVRGAGGEARCVQVERAWPHKGRFVLKIEGVDTIEGAERLRGSELRIPEEDLEPLPEGSYYYHHLRGLHVEDASGAPLGVVDGVMDTGASARVLVVNGVDGEALVPFAAPFVRTVDLAGGRIVVDRPEYVVAD